MFEVGFSELLLIMGLALLVLGPEKLPKVVGEIGRWMGRARAMARQFREQLEIEADETARRKQAATTQTDAAADIPSAASTETAPVDPLAPVEPLNPATPAAPDATETAGPPPASAVEDYVARHNDDPPRG